MKFTAHKRGVKVHIPRNILNPNNGLARYSQFFEAVNFAVQQEITDKVYLQQAADNINIVQERNADPSKGKKIKFIARQVELLGSNSKQYTTSDYCFGVESFPRCSYKNLCEFLVLPSAKTIRAVISATDVRGVVKQAFKGVIKNTSSASR